LNRTEALAQFLTQCRDDPVFFAKHMLGLDLHPGQQQWLRHATTGTYQVRCLVPGNRWGKSTVVAVGHLWRAFTKRNWIPDRKDQTWGTAPYRTISVSHSADQAEIVFGMAKQMAESPAIKPFIKRVYATPFPTIVFTNGATITCRSAHDGGKYIDGHAFRYVSIDEAGWIDELKNLINNVILMRMAGGGELELLGTPKGISEQGLYWYAMRGLRGVEGFYTQRGSTFDNIFLPAEDIKRREELLAKTDPRMREQVIYGAFVTAEGLAFSVDALEQTFDRTLPAHQDYVEGHSYVQAWDLGRKNDATVGVTFDVTKVPWVLVDYQRLVQMPWEAQYEQIRQKAKEYHVHMPRIDASGPQGDVISEELAKRGIFVDECKVNSGAIKLNLINTLQTALEHNRQTLGLTQVPDEAGHPIDVPVLEPPGEGEWGLLRMPPIAQLVDEFGIYQIDDKRLTQDSVMAVAMAVDILYDGMLLADPVIGGIY
jgi:hypothetical protein